MNSESPFRVSSMVLTVGCILCGITAASYLAAQFAPRRNSVDQTTVAAGAQQVNLSEFQSNGGQSVAQNQHAAVASGTLLLPASNIPEKNAESPELLRVPADTEQSNCKNKEMTTLPDREQTTSVEHSASPCESEGHLVPYFCVPVTFNPTFNPQVTFNPTFNPVFVNIDNAEIIREISRVHERLDLLSAEARMAQSRAALRDALATAPAQHSDVQPNESSSQEKVRDEPTNHTSPRKLMESECPLMPATEPQPSPESRSAPTRLPAPPLLPATPGLPPSSPETDVTFAVPTVPLRETFLPISVSEPAAAAAVTPSPVSVPDPMPEVQFEMTPHQPVDDIPIFEPPAKDPPAAELEAFEPEAVAPEAVGPEAVAPEAVGPEAVAPAAVGPEAVAPEALAPEAVAPEAVAPVPLESQAGESASLLSIEFSAEAFAVPKPKDALGITPQNDLQFLPIPVSDFFEPTAQIAPPVPVQWPVLPGAATLAVPSSQSAKRTTDPPFMNGRNRRVPAPPAQVAKEPIGAMQRVSHTTHASGKHTTQSDGTKCTVAKPPGNPTYPIQSLSPAQAFRRIKSALSH